MRLVALLLVLVVGVAACKPMLVQTSSKKLVEFGWDKPFPKDLNREQLEGSVFDGVVFRSGAGERGLGPAVLSQDALDRDVAALQAMGSQKLASSFYDVQSYADQNWDWFDDAGWAVALNNWAALARVAKQGGLRGLMFDAETYGFNIWDYNAQSKAKSVSFAQYEAKLRERGASAMRALQSEYPNITLLALWWLSVLQVDVVAAQKTSDPYATLHAQLEEDNMGLYAAFIEGMVEGAGDGATVVDGNEGSYYFLSEQDFAWSKGIAQNQAVAFIRPELREKYKRLMRFGNAVFVDGLLDLYKSARFFGYYLASDQERLDVLTHNTYHALRSSDEFVWVYSENPNWWSRKLPLGLESALARAKSEAAQGGPLSQDPSEAIQKANVKFKARVSVGGDMLGTKGRVPDFGMGVDCATWSNASRWSCTRPGGSSFVVQPKLEGVTFDPPSRSYQNVTKDQWQEHFVAR